MHLRTFVHVLAILSLGEGQVPSLLRSLEEEKDIHYNYFGNQIKKSDVLYIAEGFSHDERAIRDILARSESRLRDFYLPTNSSSEGCQEAMTNLERPISVGTFIRMADSWGKWPDGILYGNLFPYGMYDQCLSIEDERFGIKGRYCKLEYSLNLGSQIDSKLKRQHPGSVSPTIGFFFGSLVNTPLPYTYGTCIPDACNAEDLEDSLIGLVSQSPNIVCYPTTEEKPELTAADISLIVFLCTIALILVLASGLDFATECEERKYIRKKTVSRYLLTFSFYSNFRKIFSVISSSQPGSISCIHGLRFFSMVWVVYGHQYSISLLVAPNTFGIPSATDSLLFQIFANATFCVDSFFFMGGLVLSYITLKQMDKNGGKFQFVMFYVHRYVRLVPAIALIVWYQSTLIRYFVHGPISDHMEQYAESCQKNWWKNLLFINNYANELLDAYDRDCIIQGWYLATDTQIYIFMPLLLIPLYKFRKWGKALITVLTVLVCISGGLIIAIMELPPFYRLLNSVDDYVDYTRYIYHNPAIRAGPYLVGMLTGAILFDTAGKKIVLKYWQLAIGWLLSTCIAILVLFGMYSYNNLTDLSVDFSWATLFFYGGFSRTAWALPLAWIVLMCQWGYGGPINYVLSHPSLQPLSRLTYTMYLVSFGVQVALMFRTKVPVYFDHVNRLIEACGALFVIGVAATAVSTMVESPVMGIEKEILRKDKVEKDDVR